MANGFLRAYVRFRSGWGYIGLLTALVVGWIGWNCSLSRWSFDPPPFIVLNLLLSIEAAYAMPVFLREQYRTAAEDRALLQDIEGDTEELVKRAKEILRRLNEEGA